jgi:hypothetical protein
VKVRPLPTLSRLRQVLSYDYRTGTFRWLTPPWNHPRLKGQVAGTNVGGYVSIQIDKVLYRAHRLAWLYMTGCPPLGELDHRNRKPADNRWCNLRPATKFENARNHTMTYKKASGLPVGVRLHRKTGRYEARIRVNGRTVSLGCSATAKVASGRYVAALRRWFGDFSPV